MIKTQDTPPELFHWAEMITRWRQYALILVTQCFTGLQDTVNQLLKTSGHTEKVYDENKEKFNLYQWYASNKSCPNDNAFFFNMCKECKEISNQIKEFAQIPL